VLPCCRLLEIAFVSSIMVHLHLHALLLGVLRLAAWLLLLALVFMPLERLTALHSRNLFGKRLAGDIGFYFISGLIPSLLLTPPLALVAVGAHAVIPPSVYATVAVMPVWLRALTALVVGEIGFYWGHRWTHEIPLLWRFHAIHHHPTEVYFLISSRAHPIDNVFTRLCGLIPVYVLGIATPLTPSGGAVSALLVLTLTMWGFLIHANLRWRFGPLEWLISTPAFHHWHHTLSEPRDRNYASMLPVMDMIFGSYYLPRTAWPSAYGITTTLPGSLTGQLACPFRVTRQQVHLVTEIGPASRPEVPLR
jgi:sterol desaturase/sphingolipid hydroxylase (fatty acid hydroxylase superfamily)